MTGGGLDCPAVLNFGFIPKHNYRVVPAIAA